MYNNDKKNVESQIIKDVQINHSLHFNVVGAMDCVYFLLVRSSANCSVSHTNENLATILCDHWPMVIELLEPMNSGRLVTFYGYMCYSNTSWTAQYKFHRKLYVDSQTDHKRHVVRPYISFQFKSWAVSLAASATPQPLRSR